MQFIFILFGVFSRITILCLYFFTNYLSQVSVHILPFTAGLLLAPFTTLYCAYLLSDGNLLMWYHGILLFGCVLFDFYLDKCFIKKALRE